MNTTVFDPYGQRIVITEDPSEIEASVAATFSRVSNYSGDEAADALAAKSLMTYDLTINQMIEMNVDNGYDVTLLDLSSAEELIGVVADYINIVQEDVTLSAHGAGVPDKDIRALNEFYTKVLPLRNMIGSARGSSDMWDALSGIFATIGFTLNESNNELESLASRWAEPVPTFEEARLLVHEEAVKPSIRPTSQRGWGGNGLNTGKTHDETIRRSDSNPYDFG